MKSSKAVIYQRQQNFLKLLQREKTIEVESAAQELGVSTTCKNSSASNSSHVFMEVRSLLRVRCRKKIRLSAATQRHVSTALKRKRLHSMLLA